MKTLHLTLKKKWFDMIASGVKKEEYRELKPYWIKRLVGREYDVVKFTNGYSKTSPTESFRVLSISIGRGRVELGAPENRNCFIIRLGKIIK